VSRPLLGFAVSQRLRFAPSSIVLAIAALLLFGGGPVLAKAGPDGFSDLAAKLLPSVVNVSTTQTLKADRQRPEVPQFPPGSPFEEFFKDFLDRNLPRGQQQRPDAPPKRARPMRSAPGTGISSSTWPTTGRRGRTTGTGGCGSVKSAPITMTSPPLWSGHRRRAITTRCCDWRLRIGPTGTGVRLWAGVTALRRCQ